MKFPRHHVTEREPSRLAARANRPSTEDGPRVVRLRPLRAGTARAPVNRWSGFSLLEVMVAILILAIALAGLVHGITTALSSSKESELQTVAALFAQGKIEEMRAEGILEDGEEEGNCGTMLAMYRWRETVSSTDIPGLHEVNVVVEHAQTGREIYELKTQLFTPDGTNTHRHDKGTDSRKRRNQQS